MATIERKKTGEPAALPDHGGTRDTRNEHGRTPWENRNARQTVH